MAGPRRLSELVAATSERLALPDGDLVAALSGGADSAAMTLLVQRAGREVRALHVDHQLAGSPLMRAAARSVAEALDVDLTVVEVAVGEGPSPEGQARSARYGAFAEATRPEERVLTGHTIEDSVETTLLNLLRGTGPTGLAGIPPHRPPNVYRPILTVSRAETRELAALCGLDYAEDPMNADTSLTRNLLRREIMPGLERINPSVVGAVARAARLVGADDAYLDRLADGLGPTMGEETASIPVGVLVTADRTLADRALTRMLGHVLGPEHVDSAMVERAWSVARGESARQEMASGVWAERTGPLLALSGRPSHHDDAEPVELVPGRRARAGGLEFDVIADTGICQVAPLSKWSALFPAGIRLSASPDGMVLADGEEAWVPGELRLPVAWYDPGSNGYLVASARRTS